jgi:hypothetical protein
VDRLDHELHGVADLEIEILGDSVVSTDAMVAGCATSNFTSDITSPFLMDVTSATILSRAPYFMASSLCAGVARRPARPHTPSR